MCRTIWSILAAAGRAGHRSVRLRDRCGGSPPWVIRPESAEALGRFLGEGLVGLGVGSGMSADVGGLDLPDLREAVGGRGRVTRPLLALARFLGEVQVGDQIAVLVQGGATLLVGRVVGEYEFAGGGGPATHVRRVRWVRRLPVPRPAARGVAGRPAAVPGAAGDGRRGPGPV